TYYTHTACATASPRNAAPRPAPMLATTFSTAYGRARSSSSRSVSYPNVEYVVSAPHSPVPSSALTPPGTACTVTPRTSTPSTNDPATLTAKVPQGNSESCHACTARSTRYRSGAPTAAPSATRNTVTAAPGRRSGSPPP